MANADTVNSDIEIRRIAKNKSEEVRVVLREYNGHQLLSLQVWFASKDGDMRPSGKGLHVNVRLADELGIAIAEAIAKAKGLGWLG